MLVGFRKHQVFIWNTTKTLKDAIRASAASSDSTAHIHVMWTWQETLNVSFLLMNAWNLTCFFQLSSYFNKFVHCWYDMKDISVHFTSCVDSRCRRHEGWRRSCHRHTDVSSSETEARAPSSDSRPADTHTHAEVTQTANHSETQQLWLFVPLKLQSDSTWTQYIIMYYSHPHRYQSIRTAFTMRT